MFHGVRADAVSVTVSTPSAAADAVDEDLEEVAGTPTPPWPEIAAGSPLRAGAPVLSPAVIVMLRPTTSARRVSIGVVGGLGTSLSASRTAPGAYSVTSPFVDTIWPTRRSPGLGRPGRAFSVAVMKPFVWMWMSPLCRWTSM